MRVYIADFEGYYMENQFIIKELCLMNLLHPLSDTYHVMLHMEKHPKSKKDLRTARWLLTQWHHLPMKTIFDVTQVPAIPNGSILLVKGLEKTQKIREIYPYCIVMDPFTNCVDSFNTYNIYHACKYFKHGTHCAYKKCVYLQQQFLL